MCKWKDRWTVSHRSWCFIRIAILFFIVIRKIYIRIVRKLRLEKLLSNRRSAKITARRKTVAFDYGEPSTSSLSSMILFKKVYNKPFLQRRRSVGMGPTNAKNWCTSNYIERGWWKQFDSWPKWYTEKSVFASLSKNQYKISTKIKKISNLIFQY